MFESMRRLFYCADQLDTSTSPPPTPEQSPGIWTFEDWIVQISASLGTNSVQMLYPIAWFLCKMPLLKWNPRRLLSSLIKLAYMKTHQHMSRDPLYDDTVYKNTTLILKTIHERYGTVSARSSRLVNFRSKAISKWQTDPLKLDTRLTFLSPSTISDIGHRLS